jgi:hypothetical protein
MKTRDAVIEYQKTLDDSGTLIKDLDLVDPVSALYLEFQATNGTVSNKNNFLSDVVTKIEVTDGSEVLYSLSLAQLEALYWYKTRKMPALFPSSWASGSQRHGVYLLFGRYLWDPTFNMDFRRYTNPQLKITSNLAAIRTIDTTTSFATGTLKATIVGKVMEDVPSAPSFLQAKEIEAFTSASSGEKRVDLPADYPYRMLMLRFWLQGYDIDEIVSDIKLTFDTDKYVAFNRKTNQLDCEAFIEFGSGRLKHDFIESHQDKVRLLFNKEPDCRPYYQSLTTPEIVGIDYQWSSEAKFNIFDAAASAVTTDAKHTMVEEGHALHATLPILFGLPDIPATWFDPRPYKKIEAVLTQATASAACSVVVEQVR